MPFTETVTMPYPAGKPLTTSEVNELADQNRRLERILNGGETTGYYGCEVL